MSNQPQRQAQQPARRQQGQARSLVEVKKNTVDLVQTRIQSMMDDGKLQLPANYSAANALTSAWLILQETVDKNKQPVLQTCSQVSIYNSLLDMVVQGLNPAKKQGYFVAYGTKLTFMRSYFGSMALVKDIYPEADIYYACVYEGDEFEYELERGRRKITKHKQSIGNVKSGNIVAAYCVIEPGGNRMPHTEIMTIDQIKRAWKQGIQYKEGGDGVHQKFDDQMAAKTVINRACKAIINSSSDNRLFLRSFNRSDEDYAEDEINTEVDEFANRDVIDVEFEHVPGDEGEPPLDVDPDTGEVVQQDEETPSDVLDGTLPGF